MKHLMCLIPLVLCAAGVFAVENPAVIFSQGNEAYANGDFGGAAAKYEALAAAGDINAALFYNLGDAYYRLQRPGKAIVNYERALRLAPRDKDIRDNLFFVRQQVKEPEPSFGITVTTWFNRLLSLNELTVLTSTFFLLLVAGIIAYILTRRAFFLVAGIPVACLFLICAVWLPLKISHEVGTAWGVTVAGPVDVRNGPGPENSIGFTLPEGRTVILLGGSDGWTAVGLPSEGLKGWVEERFVEKI